MVHPVTLGRDQARRETKLRVGSSPPTDGPRPVGTPDGPLEFAIHPGQTITLKVKVERAGHKGRSPSARKGPAVTCPFGVFVDNLGLNGLLILEDQDERTVLRHGRRVGTPSDAAVPSHHDRRGRPLEPAGGAARKVGGMLMRGGKRVGRKIGSRSASDPFFPVGAVQPDLKQ